MSSRYITSFAVRDMKIMQNTLTQLGYKFTENKDGLKVNGVGFSGIQITEKRIECDSMYKQKINKIKIEYGRNLARSIIENEGLLYDEVETDQEIILNF